jgi:hypothetical protein
VGPATILEGARRYAVERAGQEQTYTKHPANWLREQAWENEPEPVTAIISRPPSLKNATVLDEFNSVEEYVRAGMNRP